MKTILLPFIEAGFGVTTSFSAAAQSSNPQDLLPNLNPEMVELVLDQAGMNAELRYAEGNGEYLHVTYEGQSADFYGTACIDWVCAGMQMLVILDDATDPETVNRFNATYATVSAIDLGNGKVALQRYLIADHGITRGSLQVNARVFFNAIDLWREFE